MPKKTSTQRLVQHIERYGVDTIHNLMRKFDLADSTIHNICANSTHPVRKSPVYIMGELGTYKKWSTAKLRSNEIITLIAYASRLRKVYEILGHEQYKVQSLILVRKAMAQLLDILVEFEMMEYKDKLVHFPEEEITLANEICDSINQAIKFGRPVFKGIGVGEET